MHLLCRWHRRLCFLLLSADAAVSSCLSTAEVGWLVLAVPCVFVVALVVLAAAFVSAGVVTAPAAVPAARFYDTIGGRLKGGPGRDGG